MAHQIRYYRARYQQSSELIKRMKVQTAEVKSLKKFLLGLPCGHLTDDVASENLRSSLRRMTTFGPASVPHTLLIRERGSLRASSILTENARRPINTGNSVRLALTTIRFEPTTDTRNASGTGILLAHDRLLRLLDKTDLPCLWFSKHQTCPINGTVKIDKLLSFLNRRMLFIVPPTKDQSQAD
jgi:hypothetical protein